ncbi:MAG: hypothetical protein JRI23_19580 [Deltaproteobacteria bacterium]|jgi:3-oxoacyl-[acyl-carrier-protein] synthase-1|nr:hypothetical protein [Deltaproteobacteria bacterium]MBW2534067.1 hypothetical protein [Deltaproteobacteria bacterium]
MSEPASDRPWVVRVGARSPLGLTALQVAMCSRADKLEPRRAPLLDKRQQLVGMVRARFLPDDRFGVERLVALGAPALAEAGHRLGRPLPLSLALPDEDRPGAVGDTVALVEQLAERSGVALDCSASTTVQTGHASFAEALERGLDILEGGAPAVVVGGLDSYYHPETVAWLDEASRLHGPGTEDGFIPGEGAGFALIERSGLDEQARASLHRGHPPRPLALIRHVATAEDRAGAAPDSPSTAAVMTELVRQAAERAGEPVGWVQTDLNGEGHRIREWSQVSQRCPSIADALQDRLPASMGDVGAATGALALTVSCARFGTACAPAPTTLVALHSDGEARGVLVARGVPWQEARA